MKNYKGSVLKLQSSHSLATSSILIGFSFVSSIILNRFLGPEKKGILTLILSFSSFAVMFFNFGIGTSNLYFGGKNKFSFNNLASNSLFSLFLFSPIAIVISYFFVQHFSNNIFQNVPQKGIVIGLVLIIFEMGNKYVQSLLQLQRKIYTINYINLISQVFLLLMLIVGIIIFKVSIILLALFFLLSAILYFGLALYFIKINLFKLKVNKLVFKKSLKYGFINHMFYVVKNLNYRVDFFLVGYYLSVENVAFYALASKLAELIYILPNAFNSAMLPKISKTLKKSISIQIIAKGTRIFFFTSFIIGIFFLLFGKFFIVLLYSKNFIASYLPLIILLPGVILHSSADLLASYFSLVIGKPIINFYVGLGAFLLNFIANFYFIPKYGIAGAAFTSSISYGIAVLILLYIIKSFEKIKLFNFFILTKSDIKDYITFTKKLLRIY